MGERAYRSLVRIAVLLTVAWIGWTFYDSRPSGITPEAQELSAAGRYLEDGQYAEALLSFDRALAIHPGNNGALRGKAQTLMRMGIQQANEARERARDDRRQEAAELLRNADRHWQSALKLYDRSIDREITQGIDEANRQALGVAFANRGILKDRLGDYAGALDDYRRSIRLEPTVAEGPGLLTRFLRNQSAPPPTVADRARYLAQQLAKPVGERLMRLPDEDAKQRAYRMD